MVLFPHHDEPPLNDIIDYIAYAGAQHGTTSSFNDDDNPLNSQPCTATAKEQAPCHWLSINTRYAFATAAQHACTPFNTKFKRWFNFPNLGLIVHHCNESVAPDTMHSNTSAIDDKVTVAHLFDDCDSLVCSIYGTNSGKQLVTTLEDIIQVQGAPTKSDSVCIPVEISENPSDLFHERPSISFGFASFQSCSLHDSGESSAGYGFLSVNLFPSACHTSYLWGD